MKLYLFLILSQSVFAAPLCEPSATKAKVSIEDKMSPLLHLTRVNSTGSPKEDKEGEEKDKRPFTKEVTCMMSLKFAYHVIHRDDQWVSKQHKESSTVVFPLMPFRLPEFKEPGVLYLRRSGGEFVTRDHLEPSHNRNVREMAINSVNWTHKKYPTGMVAKSAQFIPRAGVQITVVDEDLMDGGFVTTKPPYIIEDKEALKAAYRAGILDTFKELRNGQWLNPSPKDRLGKALCDCIKVNDKEVQKEVEKIQEEMKVALSCELAV